jgi:phage repressor protein C with HTH and peptisase S24 domain
MNVNSVPICVAQEWFPTLQRMVKEKKKLPLTAEQLEDARRLRAKWEAFQAADDRFTQEWLADQCGWKTQGAVSQYLSGAIPLNLPALLKLSEVLGFAPADVSPKLAGLLPKGESREAGSGYGAEQHELDPDVYVWIPRYQVQGRAGSMRESQHELIEKRLPFRRDWLNKKNLHVPALAMIEVDGDSMSPTLMHGDAVLIDTLQRAIQNGKIYAFRQEDGTRIKRLFRQMDGRVRVVSDNPDKVSYPDDWLAPGMDANVIGRLVYRSGDL